jgi:hypothetical protein
VPGHAWPLRICASKRLVAALLRSGCLAEGGAVKTKTHLLFRIDVWDGADGNIVEHVAGVDDFETAVATYRAAVRRWPKARSRAKARG